MAAYCVLCGKVHGVAPSVRNLWHQCTTCGAVFCDDCGRERLPGKRGLMDGTRQCVKCGGRTHLVSIPQESHATSDVPELGRVQRGTRWDVWFSLFLQISLFVVVMCGVVSAAIVLLFTGFQPEKINWKAVTIIAAVLFVPGEYIGIRILLRIKRKAKQRDP